MKYFNRYYKELNKEQREAVDYLEGPLLVLAGPGTGKTQILSIRASNIILQRKALPENILILTYTNAAAKTMKERLTKIIGYKGYDVYVATFHSFANSIILDSEEAAEYLQERIQISDIEQVKAIEYILDHVDGLSEIRPFNAPYTYVPEIQRRISDLKREGVTPEEFLVYVKDMRPDGIYIEEKHIPRIKALAIVYNEYERLKEGRNKELFDERGRYDFDDMIMLATKALDSEKRLKEKYENQFLFFMVDEFQDTNGAQLKLLFSILKDKRPNLCCVGDDDQSIYRFQGATLANFRELEKRFRDLKIITLKNNYRSAREIIRLYVDFIEKLPIEERTCRKILIPVRDFKHKSIEYWEFTTEEEELIFLVDKVKELKVQILSSDDISEEEKRFPYNNIAILVRKRDQILKIIDKFLQAGIPYATDGKEDIRNEKRVRQMLDVLDLVSLEPENYKEIDRILYKILIADYFEIPHTDILHFIAEVRSRQKEGKDVTLLSELLKGEGLTRPLLKAREIIGKLLKEAPFKPVHTTLMEYINATRLYRYILEKYDKHKIIRIRELRALISFINMVKTSDISHPGLTLRDFIEEIRTRNEHNMAIQGELVTMTQNGVRIFTAHGSKGQEFHSVIIPFCLQDKSWPIRPPPITIPLSPEIIKSMECLDSKEKIKELTYFDESRLFYVAMSRARSNVIFTASPQENTIPSSFLYKLGIKPKRNTLEEEKILIKSIESPKTEDPFIGTEEILQDLVSNIGLNPTSLNNYLTCKRKFLYDDVLMLPGAKKQSIIFGNAVHAGLEQVFRHFIRTDRFPDFQFFRERFIESLRFQGPEKAMELRCIEHFEGLRRYFEKISKAPIKPIGLENRMPINIDGIVFTGKYDKLEIEDREKKLVRVIDYKTGTDHNRHARGLFESRNLEDKDCDEYLRQLVCYKLLYERDVTRADKDYKVSHGVLIFVEPAKGDFVKYGIKKGEPTEFKIELRDDMVDEMISIIKNTYRSIQHLDFQKLPERDGDICRWCDFDHICWG